MTSVAGSDYHVLAAEANGTVWAWGYNGSVELGDGTTTERKSPIQVPGVSHVTAIANGYDAVSLALLDNGTVMGAATSSARSATEPTTSVTRR